MSSVISFRSPILLLFLLFGCVSTDFDFRPDSGEGVSSFDSGPVDSGPTFMECFDNSHCTRETASVCTEHECRLCSTHTDCAHIPGKHLCQSQGTSNVSCVQCTLEHESECEEFSCNLKTNLCTSTPRRTLQACESCVSDSECTLNHRCIEMTFLGLGVGGYCFPIATSDPCPLYPFSQRISRPSVSGHPVDEYCAINEMLTTCGAILDFGKPCSMSEDCGLPKVNDAPCRYHGPNTSIQICTHFCLLDTACPPGFQCTTTCQWNRE